MDRDSREVWCRGFAEVVASALLEGPYTRVEIDREGGYWFQEKRGRGAGSWWHFDEDSGSTSPVGILGDRALRRAHPQLDRALSSGASLELLAHRPGRRAVVRLTSQREEDAPYLKLYRRDRDTELRWNAMRPPGIKVPRVRWDSESRSLEISPIAGEGFHDRWRRGRASEDDGSALATVVMSIAASPGATPLPVHTVEDEISLLERELGVSERLADRARPRRRDLVRQVVAALRELPIRDPVGAHRDLHDKQILFEEVEGEEGARCGVIDWDLAALAPPGLDAGNLLAHIRLRGLEYLQEKWRVIASRYVEDLSSHGGGAALDLPVWTAATLTRLVFVCERRAREYTHCDALIDQAIDALSNRGDWEGLVQG